MIFQLFWLRFSADFNSLELFLFQGSVFGRFSAMFRRVGAKMATKSGRMGGLGRIMGSRWIQEGPGSMLKDASQSCLVPFSINTNQSNSTANITSPIHAPVLEARWQIFI